MIEELKNELDSFLERDPAARSRFEVALCYPGFHAIVIYRFTHKLWKRDWKLLARFMSQMGRWLTGVEIHPGARIGERLFIDHGMGVVIGETAYIGHDVTIYHGVTLGGVSPTTSAMGSLRHPQVGDGVIIGSGAQLLGPIEVGDYARIGSNAVVVSDVPVGATMVGIPAREVRSRTEREDAHPFAAYAVEEPGKIQDPTEKRLQSMMQELEALQRRIRQLEGDEMLEETADSWENPRQ